MQIQPKYELLISTNNGRTWGCREGWESEFGSRPEAQRYAREIERQTEGWATKIVRLASR